MKRSRRRSGAHTCDAYDGAVVKATGAGAAQRVARRLSARSPGAVGHRPRTASNGCPPSGPAILCPNHISFLDSAFLMLSVPRNISFVGKAEYMHSWKTKFLFPVMGMIPIDRSGGSKVGDRPGGRRRGAAPRRAVRDLPRGHPQPRRPAAQGAHRGGTPGARGRRADLSRRHRRHRPDPAARRQAPKLCRSCSITIGRPIGPERYAAMPERHRALRAMTDEVMFEIRELDRPGIRRSLRRQVRRRRRRDSRGRPADPRRRLRAHPTETAAATRRAAVGRSRVAEPVQPARATHRSASTRAAS